ncbi:MAG TPA: helix-turn-helix transcriptional regulator [Bacteroidia bacterium]|jgi:DNA-binding CsgD family transcriptional regulator|nr:helix-turn-helix transcriptional regulator [Bacteroidia bacterium]
MLVFGTQIHIVTFIFILLEAGMFAFQFFYYLFRPEDKSRLWYLILLALLLFYNITGGLFPDPKINLPIATQMMVAYGSGFLMASYFPFYFYKAFDLKSLRWHALYGVPLFLMLPYLIFFVVIYAINGNLNVDIKYGMIVPLIYALTLLWLIFRAIRKKYKAGRDKNEYLEEIAMYYAIIPWASLAFFGIVEQSQLVEVLCTNTGIIVITILFIRRSIQLVKMDYLELEELRTIGKHRSPYFEENCIKFGLTKREIEIVQFIRQGSKNKIIADILNISESTVKKHIENLFHKTNSSTRIELIHKLVFVRNE